ncbi:MAG: molybdate ABC transporter permease subunit [Rhodospirillales bacterium]
MTELFGPESMAVLGLSLRVALTAVAISLPFGILAAWALARWQFPGKLLLDGIIHIPLVLPPVVIGYGLLVLLGTQGVVGRWLGDVFGITLAFSWQGAALAAAVMAFPLLVRAVRLGFEAVDQRFELAARTLGASPVDVFFSVSVPLALPGIMTGILLAFARALGEFGATITFVSNIPGETRTLPLAIYSAINVPGGEARALSLVVIAVLISLGAVLLSEVLARRMRRRLDA